MRIYLYLLFGGCTVCAICFVPGTNIVSLGILMLSLAVGGIFACHRDWRIAALYAALIVEILQISYGIAKSLSSILYPHLAASWQEIPSFVLMLAEEMVGILLTGGCCFLIQRYFSDEMYFAHNGIAVKYHILLVFIPVLMLLIMDDYINFFSYGIVVTSVDGRETYLYTNYYQMLVMQLLEIAGLFCVLYAYKKLLYSFRLRTELLQLEQEEHSLRQYVEEAKERYEKTKSFRHDIKNHITVVKELLQKGQPEQALNYIGNMESMTADLFFPCNTNNPVVDILLANKLGMAKSSGISVHCSLLLPCSCAANDIDLCIILSNALDNAIGACKEMNGDTENIYA